MTTLPKQPPLPEPTIMDNRRLYTAGDLREHSRAYGQQCFEAGTQHQPAKPEQAGKYSQAFEDVFPWMKK